MLTLPCEAPDRPMSFAADSNGRRSISMTWCGIDQDVTAVVVGARGGIGAAFVDALKGSGVAQRVYALSRDAEWCGTPARQGRCHRVQVDVTCEASLATFVQRLASEGAKPNFVINCSGLLHEGGDKPERRLSEIDGAFVRKVFDVNTIGVMLLMKHLLPVMPRQSRAIFATLSARVGSISDNRLGGWYSYRASKAAQNMLVKTAAIETSHRSPQLIVVSLHPGTVATDLSDPFTKRLRPGHAVFSPHESCAHLRRVMEGLQVTDSGGFFAWDGAPIPW